MAFARIGVVAAVAEEAAAFMPDAAARWERHGRQEVRIVEHGARRIAIHCCGVGKVNAALAAAMLVHAYETDLLLIIGTAGRLGPIPGRCFVIREAMQGDYGARRSDGFAHYTAGAWPIGPGRLEAFAAHPLPDIGLPAARIVTADSFVECPDYGRGLRDSLGGDLIDMETGALAQAALRLGTPWAAIKAVTDEADGSSADDFAANLAAAARLAAEAAERAIAAFDDDQLQIRSEPDG